MQIALGKKEEKRNITTQKKIIKERNKKFR
jgi:hypothetical protein